MRVGRGMGGCRGGCGGRVGGAGAITGAASSLTTNLHILRAPSACQPPRATHCRCDGTGWLRRADERQHKRRAAAGGTPRGAGCCAPWTHLRARTDWAPRTPAGGPPRPAPPRPGGAGVGDIVVHVSPPVAALSSQSLVGGRPGPEAGRVGAYGASAVAKGPDCIALPLGRHECPTSSRRVRVPYKKKESERTALFIIQIRIIGITHT
jgi:hypothetical protein